MNSSKCEADFQALHRDLIFVLFLLDPIYFCSTSYYLFPLSFPADFLFVVPEKELGRLRECLVEGVISPTPAVAYGIFQESRGEPPFPAALQV